ncbi:DNA methyltransferase [Actinocatenispora sera]|uniref:DNA methyltransferase n=1 Tax=Actinocatenispora sera TaxID=390989 RepID=UPI0033ECBD1A
MDPAVATPHPCTSHRRLRRPRPPRRTSRHPPRPAEVCDPFSGSGTTGYAALTTGRRYLGIDLEPRYHQQLLVALDPNGERDG